MTGKISVSTRAREQMIDITGEVRNYLHSCGADSGLACVFVTHTTAAVTINENADPDVPRDILHGLEKIAPLKGGYHHSEGNSDAHIKSSLVGSSVTVIVENGKPVLGTWQSIFFCEFDGPRTRSVAVKYIKG